MRPRATARSSADGCARRRRPRSAGAGSCRRLRHDPAPARRQRGRRPLRARAGSGSRLRGALRRAPGAAVPCDGGSRPPARLSRRAPSRAPGARRRSSRRTSGTAESCREGRRAGTSARIASVSWPSHSPASGATATRADENSLLAVGGELHESRALRPLVRREPSAGDLVARRDDALALHLADGRDLRVGEHRRRDRPVVGAHVATRDVRRRHARLVLAEVREEPDARDVADRPDAVARAKAVVDRDPAPGDLDLELLEPEPVDVRATARRDEQPLGLECLIPSELEADVPSRSLRPARPAASTSTRTPSSSSRSRSRLPASGSSLASTRSWLSTSVTSEPMRRKNCASSAPTGPPPSTTRLRGHALDPDCVACSSSTRRASSPSTVRNRRRRARRDDELVVRELAIARPRRSRRVRRAPPRERARPSVPRASRRATSRPDPR